MAYFRLLRDLPHTKTYNVSQGANQILRSTDEHHFQDRILVRVSKELQFEGHVHLEVLRSEAQA
jgi:hypothetical protein